MKTFTAYIEWDPETKLYIGIIPAVSGAHTQGASLDELHKNLKEVLELCLEETMEINIWSLLYKAKDVIISEVLLLIGV